MHTVNDQLSALGSLFKNKRFLVGIYLDCALNRTMTLIKKIKKLKTENSTQQLILPK